MLEAMRKRLGRDEEGFTLIELMVVVLIIAILVAIAVPTFLGARKKAQDRGAQSNLRNALTAAKTVYTDTNDFNGLTEALLEGVEPSLDFVGGPVLSTAASNSIAWAPSGTIPADTVTFTAYSKSGKCWYMKQTANAAAKYGVLDAPTSGCAVGDTVDWKDAFPSS